MNQDSPALFVEPLNLRRPVCIVVVPFGLRMHPDSGITINFDGIYSEAVKPALHNAGMDPVRIDQDVAALREPSVQQDITDAEFLLVDATTRAPAILFLLGSRAERRPGTTLVIAARSGDAKLDRGFSVPVIEYNLDEGNRMSRSESYRLKRRLTEELTRMKPSLPGGQSDRFAEAQSFAAEPGGMAAVARAIEAASSRLDVAALRKLEAELMKENPRSELLLNIFQAYWDLGEWVAAADLFGKLPKAFRSLPRVRQQAGRAFSGSLDSDQAIKILSGLLEEFGPDSETLGLLGQVYKDRWFLHQLEEPSDLDRAIEHYIRGFEANRKDVYSGKNSVTLLELRGDPESQALKNRLLPLVLTTVQDQIRFGGHPDYWDYATLLELAVLAGDEKESYAKLQDALKANPQEWQAQTTAENLSLISNARKQHGVQEVWLDKIIARLQSFITAA